jgi:hypothetical protein
LTAARQQGRRRRSRQAIGKSHDQAALDFFNGIYSFNIFRRTASSGHLARGVAEFVREIEQQFQFSTAMACQRLPADSVCRKRAQKTHNVFGLPLSEFQLFSIGHWRLIFLGNGSGAEPGTDECHCGLPKGQAGGPADLCGRLQHGSGGRLF